MGPGPLPQKKNIGFSDSFGGCFCDPKKLEKMTLVITLVTALVTAYLTALVTASVSILVIALVKTRRNNESFVTALVKSKGKSVVTTGSKNERLW